MELDQRSSSRWSSTRALGRPVSCDACCLSWKKKASLRAAGGAAPWMQSGREQGYGGGKRRERGGAVASRGTKRRRRLWTASRGLGVDGISITVHPFGPGNRSMRHVRSGSAVVGGLTWSFPVSGAGGRAPSRQDGERRSSPAVMLAARGRRHSRRRVLWRMPGRVIVDHGRSSDLLTYMLIKTIGVPWCPVPWTPACRGVRGRHNPRALLLLFNNRRCNRATQFFIHFRIPSFQNEQCSDCPASLQRLIEFPQ